MSLSGQIALVTGASRGIGRGIALQLGQAGATVYITEITERGGKGIALYVDHGDMDQVKELFEKIEEESNGQLDILVNNAYSAIDIIIENSGTKFYERPPEDWDEVNNVGLRNHYFCSVYAARMMVKNEKGLIVNIGSAGGLRYLFNIPYGVGKCALDRMSADMAIELKSKGVTCVSMWPGAVRTEKIMDQINHSEGIGAVTSQMFLSGETTEYPGIAIAHLAADKNMIAKSGRTLVTADLGDEYGFKDIDGRHPPNLRSLSYLLDYNGWRSLANWVPTSVKLPGWLLTAGTSRL